MTPEKKTPENGLKLRTPSDHKEKKRHIIFSITGWITIVSWGCLLLAIILLHYARPESTYGFFGTYNETLAFRDQWHDTLTTWFLWALWTCCLLTILAIVFRIIFAPRAISKDILLYNLAILLMLAIIFLVTYYFELLV